MSTSSISILFIYKTGRVVAVKFGKYDGEPEGQGKIIHKVLLDPRNIQSLRVGLQHVRIIDANERNSIKGEAERMCELVSKLLSEIRCEPEQEDQLISLGNLSKSSTRKEVFEYIMETNWPSLDKSHSAKLLDLIAGEKYITDIPIDMEVLERSLTDSIGCWRYVVDLDSDILEVYHGVAAHETASITPCARLHVPTRGNNFMLEPRLIKRFCFEELPETEDQFVMEVRAGETRSHLRFN